MLVTVGDLVDMLKLDGLDCEARDESARYVITEGSYGILIDLFPEWAEVGEMLIPGVCIMQTFCYADGEPINVHEELEGEHAKYFGQLLEMARWSRVTFNRANEDKVVITQDRFEALDKGALTEGERTQASEQFRLALQGLLEEWRQMNNLVALIRDTSGPESAMEEKVDFFLGGYQGRG